MVAGSKPGDSRPGVLAVMPEAALPGALRELPAPAAGVAAGAALRGTADARPGVRPLLCAA